MSGIERPEKKVITSLTRRELLRYGGAAAAALGLMSLGLAGCVSADSTTDTANSDASGGTCGEIPTETAGPYPAHDDSSKNCLRFAGIVRSDIRSSLNVGGYTGTSTATGVPLTVKLRVVDSAKSCAAIAGYVVYIWHCTAAGLYSMYSSGVANETFLRGVQQTDADGNVEFQTIFPGCYDGRMTHIHFEVYPTLASAVDDGNVIKTSQLTMPMDTLNAVYNNVSGYSSSKTNLARTSYASDMVFSDGTTYQMAKVDSGDNTSGYTISLDVGV